MNSAKESTVLNVSRSGRVCRKSTRYSDFSTGRHSAQKRISPPIIDTSDHEQIVEVKKTKPVSKKPPPTKRVVESSSESEEEWDGDDGSDATTPSEVDTESVDSADLSNDSDSSYDGAPKSAKKGRTKKSAPERTRSTLQVRFKQKGKLANKNQSSSSGNSIAFTIRPKKIEDMMCPEAKQKLVDLNTITMRGHSDNAVFDELEESLGSSNKTGTIPAMPLPIPVVGGKSFVCKPAAGFVFNRGPDWTSEFTKFIQKSGR